MPAGLTQFPPDLANSVIPANCLILRPNRNLHITMSTLPVGKGALDESLALDRLGSAKFSRNLDPRFAGPYGPYGGYTAVLGMKAMMDELGPSFPHCISLTTEFFMSPKADAKVEVQVTVLRRGKTFCEFLHFGTKTSNGKAFDKHVLNFLATTSCVLSEPGNAPFAACIGTFGTLQEDGVNESPSHGHYERPNLAPPEPSQSIDGFPLFEMAGWGDGKNNGPPFTKNFEFRVEKSHFEDMKKKIQAARTAEAGHEVRRDLGLDLEMWVKMKDGRAMDCLSAGALADMLGSLVGFYMAYAFL